MINILLPGSDSLKTNHFYFLREIVSSRVEDENVVTGIGQTEDTNEEYHSVTNVYYEGYGDIIPDTRNRSIENFDLNETEVVTMSENVYYKL